MQSKAQRHATRVLLLVLVKKPTLMQFLDIDMPLLYMKGSDDTELRLDQMKEASQGFAILWENALFTEIALQVQLINLLFGNRVGITHGKPHSKYSYIA